MALDIQESINSVNLAEELDEDTVNKIAQEVARGIESDKQSRQEWYDNNQKYLEMALQIKKAKTFPWPGAANVKYPLVTIASLQFQARAYSGIVDTKAMVKGKVIGYDPTGEKAQAAERVAKHMTYQLMDKIENWDGDMDRLLLILPISGCAFKKVYYSSRHEKEMIDLVLPQDIVVNYWTSDLSDARRITHFYNLYHDEVKSRMLEGVYSDIDLPIPGHKPREKNEDETRNLNAPSSSTEVDQPHQIAECHTRIDLDKDGILEPYVVVLDWETKKCLRIAPNYDLESIKKNNNDKILEIKAKEYFVKYEFFPAPDGGFYGVGFGLLLGNLNDTASTTINQLLDAGTMATTGGGFMSKSIKLKGGRVSFEPNEWKQITFTGDDIRKALIPLPVREPSNVLMSLLAFIDQKASQIISISEISTGKLPGQNTPATTTMTSVQEGLKLFTSIYKRVYRSLRKELKLLFNINKKYLTDQEYFSVLDSDGTFQNMQVSTKDYKGDVDISAVADPNSASDSLRLVKAQQLIELIPLQAVNPAVAGQRVLEALDVPKPQELMPQQQADPKVQAAQMKMQQDAQKHQMDMQAQQQKLQNDAIAQQMELKFKMMEAMMDMHMKQQDLKMEEMKAMMQMRTSAIKHSQEMSQAQDQRAMGIVEGSDKINHQREMNQVKKEGAQNAARNRDTGRKSRGTT